MSKKKKDIIDLDIGDSYLGPATNDQGKVSCVFSTTERIKVGTGTTTRKHLSKLYWYVQQVDEREFAVQQINQGHVPSGEKFTISLEELLQDYTPEVERLEEQTLPAMRRLQDHLDAGETHREEGRIYSAENRFNSALEIDEQNVRALFNLGLIYLETKNVEKAKDMMRELVKINETFTGKNQHLFNEFGIALRKAGLLSEAVDYYTVAAEYAPEDENLHYNLSRAYYEQGDWDGCSDALVRSRTLNPKLSAARSLEKVVLKLHEDPDLCEKYGKPLVPPEAVHALLGNVADNPAVHTSQSQAAKMRRARGEAEIDDGESFDI